MALPMLHTRSILSVGLLAVIFGWGGSQPPADQAPQPPASSIATAPVESTQSPPAEAKAPEPPKEEKPAAPTPVFRIAEGVNTPESVLYDEANDRYLVSNINGKPDEADNNGYIMEV